MSRRQSTMGGPWVCTFLVSIAVSGCAGEGVELNGKIFDALGVSGNALGRREEPKTQARAPLVLPPSQTRLPEPGAAPQQVVGQQAWPQDRDQQKVAAAEEQKRKKANCQDENWKERATKPGEASPCGGSLFSILGNGLTGSSD